jgi:hypothetical protein
VNICRQWIIILILFLCPFQHSTSEAADSIDGLFQNQLYGHPPATMFIAQNTETSPPPAQSTSPDKDQNKQPAERAQNDKKDQTQPPSPASPNKTVAPEPLLQPRPSAAQNTEPPRFPLGTPLRTPQSSNPNLTPKSTETTSPRTSASPSTAPAPQPAATTQPTTGTQPDAASQPAATTQPATGTQPDAAPQPSTTTQPATGTQPAPAPQPSTTTQPTTGTQPDAAQEPCKCPQPAPSKPAKSKIQANVPAEYVETLRKMSSKQGGRTKALDHMFAELKKIRATDPGRAGDMFSAGLDAIFPWRDATNQVTCKVSEKIPTSTLKWYMVSGFVTMKKYNWYAVETDGDNKCGFWFKSPPAIFGDLKFYEPIFVIGKYTHNGSLDWINRGRTTVPGFSECYVITEEFLENLSAPDTQKTEADAKQSKDPPPKKQ